MTILAERPETLDLLRRNVQLLGASLGELGYQDISFAFSGGQPQGDQPDRGSAPNDGLAALSAPNAVETRGPQTQPQRSPDGGLDLRI